MNIIELILIAIGLSMDAFAIAICKGLSVSKVKIKHIVITGLWFGGAQAVMPLIGYFMGSSFSALVEQIDHWIAFSLLVLIGAMMIKEAFEKAKPLDDSFTAKVMFPLAIADSIDALAAGVSFVFMDINIYLTVALIGIITFLFSAVGILLGNKFGEKYRFGAEIAGGVILILMGTKTLLEHLGVLI